MKLSIAMLLVCAISLTIFAVSPKKHVNANAPTLFGECKNFSPNETKLCNHPACGNKTIQETDGNFTGNGDFSLEVTNTFCKTSYPSCEDEPVTYIRRVGDSTCCDGDNDGYRSDNNWCVGNDCVDTNLAINPGATEVCDNVDNNCNGQTDEGFDQDSDGYKTCTGDCIDTNASINPGASEVCDGIDNDCDGYTDEGFDQDEDGYTTCGGDCADDNWYKNPGVNPCSSLPWEDRNCNGLNDFLECEGSPVIIDVQGNDFNLTNVTNGVFFDLDSNGVVEKLSWTSANSDDSWLALDRNNNGRIDSGQELFGNFTPQPQPPTGETKNGFLALAEFDKLTNGGNQNGQIEIGDSVFIRLLLWQDINHNGISEPNELHTLMSRGIGVLDLDYKESKRVDQYGNQFKYRAKVKNSYGSQAGRWAWDVFLVTER